MESQLFRPLDDDVLSGGVPTNHVVILGAFEETICAVGKRLAEDRVWKRGKTDAYSFVRKVACGFAGCWGIPSCLGADGDSCFGDWEVGDCEELSWCEGLEWSSETVGWDVIN